VVGGHGIVAAVSDPSSTFGTRASTGSEPSLDGRQPPVHLRQAIVALLAVFVAEVALLGGYLLLVKSTVLRPPGPAQTAALLGAATVLAAAVLYWLLVRRGGLTVQQLGFVRPTWRLLHLLWQAPLAILASAAVGALVLWLTSGSTVRRGQDAAFADFASAGPAVVLAALVVGVVATPLWEEALFRGAFYLGFARLAGPVGAVVGSAAVFAGFHLVPALWAFLFPLGLCLGWLRCFHRNLWASVAVHALNNLLAMAAVLLPR